MAAATSMPDGMPGQCPVCGKQISITMVSPTGDTVCPACGSLLWFAISSDNVWLLGRDKVSVLLKRRVAEMLADERPDSLTVVELMMELESLSHQ